MVIEPSFRPSHKLKARITVVEVLSASGPIAYVLCSAIHALCGPTHAPGSAPAYPFDDFNFGPQSTSSPGKHKLLANLAVGIRVFDWLGLWLKTMPLITAVANGPPRAYNRLL